ncbi:MAG: hypothetical protein COB96_07035 [Planctomycetota bacterium]|nr:MAG: hypothetical protein COB96_07035 [Planctomycetota bacterium]
MLARYATSLLLGLLPWTGGCGYAVVDPSMGNGLTLDVQVPVNDTKWRSIEVGLATALRNKLQTLLDVRLGHEQADLTLKSKFISTRRGAPVRDSSGAALLGNSMIAVEWSLEDRLGNIVASGSIDQRLEFLPSAGETAYSAFAEIIDWMAESIVLEINAGIAADADLR